MPAQDSPAPHSNEPHPVEPHSAQSRRNDGRTGPQHPQHPRQQPDEHPRTAELTERWNRLLLAARDDASGPAPEPYARDLLRRWAEPQRRYHTTDHLAAVLDRLDELGRDTAHAADPCAVELAAWFHDAHYRPDRSENEERSAALAERALPEAGVPDSRTTEVARLVRLTVTHDPAPGDTNGEALCDADLAVLAGTPEEYARYAAQVREEYDFVPDDVFRTGRGNVLRQLLGLPRLYRTPHGAEHWEERARHNLHTELTLLLG
ncbi:hypothetical protein MTQ01_04745 [Streptomyces sp. XM4193]|uniref:HD domain-containing protein n=1 Tax=Streptomyces sp. XM4193 TaxID=2929782 RepID=UPI001FFB2B36|nr:hypothetical protein [Streptomyces sp. XM4193]MCK1795327.1 hypothetical protein [Streptomyces sp. XM4193]